MNIVSSCNYFWLTWMSIILELVILD